MTELDYALCHVVRSKVFLGKKQRTLAKYCPRTVPTYCSIWIRVCNSSSMRF